MTRAEKDANFRRMNKRIYQIAERGNWNDLAEWRTEFNKAVEENALLKGDAKILDKADLFAEKQVTRRARA